MFITYGTTHGLRLISKIAAFVSQNLMYLAAAQRMCPTQHCDGLDALQCMQCV